MNNLEQFQDRFTEILETKEPMRTNRLTNLMSDMEQVYSIPMRYDATFDSNHPAVMHLYRTVSKARNFEEVR